MKQKLSLLLAALMLAGSLASCASENPETKDAPDEGAAQPSAVGEETVPEVEEEAEKQYLDNLPEDLNFGGADFNWLLLAFQEQNFFVEELKGEGVNDAIYDRTIKLEDRLGVKFADVALPAEDSGLWSKTVQGSVSASDGAYDVVCPYYWWGLENKGYYADMRSLPYLDFSQPYWCAGWNDNCVIYGKQFTAFGSFTTDLVTCIEAIYFNKTVLEDNGLGNPYDLVREGTWTADKMIEMADVVLRDLNGDGQLNYKDDCFGLQYNLWSGRAFLCNMGMNLTYKTDDGGWSVDYFNDQFVAILEKMYQIQNETPCVWYDRAGGMNERFAHDQILFMGDSLGTVSGSVMRDMESDFGVIPYPKFDETQEEYISYNLGGCHGAILKSAKDPAMSAAVLEAFSAENHKTVIPALYDDALKQKYSRDPDTAEMIDLIQSTLKFDFAFVNDDGLGALCNLYFDKLVNRKNDFASIFESKNKQTQKALEKLLDYYRKAE